MNRKRATLVLIIGLLAGLAATVGASRSLSRMASEGKTPPPPKVKPVIVVKRDVKRGELLHRQDLEIASWPEEIAPPSTFQRIEEVENRVPLVRLVKGEAIFADKLANSGTLPGLAAFIEKGMRAVTVKVNEVVGVGGFVTPGNRVDVLTTIDVDPQKQGSTVTKVVLQDIQVLAVDERIDPSAPKETENVKGGPNQQKTQPNRVSVATLLVTPKESERLTLAATKGKIILALRGPDESGAVSTPGITARELVYGSVSVASLVKPQPKQSRKKARPSRPRVVQIERVRVPKVVRIEVIRAGKKAIESFETKETLEVEAGRRGAGK